MKVLCAVGLRNGPELIRQAASMVASGQEWVVMNVIDTGPEQEWESRPRGSVPIRGHDVEPRTSAVAAHEAAAAEAAMRASLQAALDMGLVAQGEVRQGQPDQAIVAAAAELGAALIVIMASEGGAGHPHAHPAGAGQIAHFVLDHAPCDVLLLRDLLV